MSFPSKSGCPMCGIVARASSASSANSPPASDSPSLNSSSPSLSAFPAAPSRSNSRTRAGKGRDEQPEIVWHDENFTVYRERAHPVSSVGHLVIIFNLHVPSLYMLSTSDVPMLVQLRELAYRLLTDLSSTSSSSRHSSSSPSITPTSPSSASPFSSPSSSPQVQSESDAAQIASAQQQFRVGFITPPWKDSQIPVKDHLHAHAYVAPMDRCGWWRSVAYSPLAWYAVEDLIAEIREESTNNRIRSSSIPTGGPASSNARPRPIDRVPNAGARSGTADGHETTSGSLAGLTELEAGRRSSGSVSVGRYRDANSYSYRRTGSESGEGSGRSPSPLMPPSPARLAAPSHLDLNAAYGSGGASASGTPLATPTKTSFGVGRVSSPGPGSGPGPAGSSGESRPGSSLGPTGSLLSPAYPPS